MDKNQQPEQCKTAGWLEMGKAGWLLLLVFLRACLKIPWETCWDALGPMARREEGGYP